MAHWSQTGEAADVEKYSKRTIRVTQAHNDECKKLLRLMGVPVVEVSMRSITGVLPFWTVQSTIACFSLRAPKIRGSPLHTCTAKAQMALELVSS